MNTFLVYVTVPNSAEAELIARTVVEERLAACANQLGAVKSFYWWDGKVCEGEEVVLILKTTDECKAELIERIRRLHSYECPCIVCLPIADGNPDFLKWIRRETEKPQR